VDGLHASNWSTAAPSTDTLLDLFIRLVVLTLSF